MRKLIVISFLLAAGINGFGQEAINLPTINILKIYGIPDNINIYGVKNNNIAYQWKYGNDTIFEIYNDTAHTVFYNYTTWGKETWENAISSGGTVTKTCKISPDEECRIEAFQRLNDDDYIGAYKAFSEAILLNQKDTISYKQRGLIKHRHKDLSGAIKDYTTAIKLTPTDANLYLNRGAVKQELENYNDAINDYLRSIAMNPKEETVYNNMGWAYYHLKNYVDACINWNKAKELGYKYAKNFIKKKCNKLKPNQN